MDQSLKNSLIFWLIPVLLLSIWHFREIIFAFFVGIILGLTIQTLALFLNYKLKLNYYLNVFLIYTLLILIVSFTFYLTFKVMIEEVPNLLLKIEPFLKEFDLPKIDFFKQWQNFLTLGGDYLLNFLKFIYNFVGGIFSLILIFIVSLYTALNKNFPQEIFNFFKHGEEYARLWRKIKRRISFWFLGQTFLMLFVGLATYIFLGPVLKINYAPSIALLAGVLEIVPILGPIFSLVFASVITYLDKPDLLFFVIGYFLLLQQIENHFLVPLMMKRAIQINPLLVIFGVLVGGKIGGILGIIIILPLLGIMTEIFSYLVSSKNKPSVPTSKTLI